MTDHPLVSIVVPSFNQDRFLREALDSILGQDYPRIEVLVVDGGSTDGTVATLASYGDRIWFASEPDAGQSDAINKGFRRARGEIVAWLNSDDLYRPGAVRHAVAALQAEPAAAMAYGDGALIDEDGNDMGPFPANQPFDLWRLIHVSDFIMQPTVFMRSAALREVGLLDESLHFGMDWDLWIRLGKRWPVAYVPRELAVTREYPATKTASGGFRRLRELRRILRCHGAPGWPPAAVAYGLDTLRKKWPVVFGPSSAFDAPRVDASRLARWFGPLHRWVTRRIESALGSSQGIYVDRWVGPLAYQALPWGGEPGALRVVGELPDFARTLWPCRVELSAKGHRVAVHRDEPGPFELQLSIGAGARADGPLEIELRSTARCRFPHDGRDLSFRLRELRFEPLASA